MEVAFGITLGVATMETILIVGVAYIWTVNDLWEEHRKKTNTRLQGWKINWKNGEDRNEEQEG